PSARAPPGRAHPGSRSDGGRPWPAPRVVHPGVTAGARDRLSDGTAVSVWNAVFWGGASSASLYIGEALAGPMTPRKHATGLVMGFGAGTLLSAIAYELIPESNLSHGFGIGIGFVLGALVYFVGDRLIDRAGGSGRQDIGGEQAQSGSGAAMFLGALLDGVPEAFILGITIETGGSVSVAFVTAVFVSNIPQGIAGTSALK